jgi:hypothetical protein
LNFAGDGDGDVSYPELIKSEIEPGATLPFYQLKCGLKRNQGKELVFLARYEALPGARTATGMAGYRP